MIFLLDFWSFCHFVHFGIFPQLWTFWAYFHHFEQYMEFVLSFFGIFCFIGHPTLRYRADVGIAEKICCSLENNARNSNNISFPFPIIFLLYCQCRLHLGLKIHYIWPTCITNFSAHFSPLVKSFGNRKVEQQPPFSLPSWIVIHLAGLNYVAVCGLAK